MITKVKKRKFQATLCRYCDSPLRTPFLDLGVMALANSYIENGKQSDDEFKCSLSVTRCDKCDLVQLTHIVPPEKMFSHYLYVSSTTKTFQKHFLDYAKSVSHKIGKEKGLSIDIGSNDGLLLSSFQKVGFRAVGVEPAKNLSDSANKNGFKTINKFFDASCVDEIKERFGFADVVTANNVFAHINDVQSVCRNVYELLSDDGIFVIEFPYLIEMMDGLLFDMIYHEHLSYLSVTSLKYLMARFDFELFAIDQVNSHGGSLRVFIKKKSANYKMSNEVAEMLRKESHGGYLSDAACEQFGNRVIETKHSLRKYISDIRSRGKSVSGYGAAAKASTIINFCKFTNEDINFIVDDNALKQNHLMPGSRIPIMPSSYLKKHPSDFVIIFAWNFAAEIIGKLEDLKQKGVKFIIPLPQPRVVA